MNVLPASYYAPAHGALSDDAVWRLASVWRLSVCLSDVCRVHPHTIQSRRRAACAAGRLRGAYWLIGPGSAGLAQGCRCALPLQAWAGAYRGGRPPTACSELLSFQFTFINLCLVPCGWIIGSDFERFWSICCYFTLRYQRPISVAWLRE